MRPLEGLTVIAIEQAVAAPFTSSRLADAGARVIKIERPEGDFARGYDDVALGQSSYFVWLNRGKESVTLDLRDPADQAQLKELLDGADVLIQNLKRGALARLGFDFDRLAREWPRLITCSITGYGEDGPMADRKAYDLLIQAESGLCSITGGPEEPARVGISIVDIATGATAHAAILEALIQRGITGKGAQISISMFDVMADWHRAAAECRAGKPPQRLGMAHLDRALWCVQDEDDEAILISVHDRNGASSDLLGRAELGRDRDLPPMCRQPVRNRRADRRGFYKTGCRGGNAGFVGGGCRSCLGQRHGHIVGAPSSAPRDGRDAERTSQLSGAGRKVCGLRASLWPCPFT